MNISDNLGKNPGGNFDKVSGYGLTLDSSVKYQITVRFEKPQKKADSNRFRRVILYHPVNPNDSKNENYCQQNECWSKLHQFTNKSTDTIYVVVSQKLIFLTFGATGTSMARGADNKERPKSPFELDYKIYENNGLKFTTNTEVGEIIVTIKPL